MSIALGYQAVRDLIAAARSMLNKTEEPQWTPERRSHWCAALDAIEADLDDRSSERGFSILRSLDMSAGTEGPTSEAILAIGGELRRSGIDRYR